MRKQNIGKIAGLAMAAAIGIGICTSANATLVLTTHGPDGTGIQNAYHITTIPNPTAAQIATGLNAISPGLNPDITAATLPTMLYKATPNKLDEYLLDGSYNVVWADDYEGATITWVGGSSPSFDTSQLTWLLVKDGNKGSYLWNLTGLWNGTDTIQIGDIFDGKSFSHLEIGGTVAVVPEPTTMIAGALLLLPFGASTLRALRRNRAA